MSNQSIRWPELQAKIQQHPSGLFGVVKETVVDNYGNMGDILDQLLLDVVEPMQEHIDDLTEQTQTLEQRRQYGSDIINDMTMEADDAQSKIAELEQRLQAALVAVPGVTLAWVVPSTTTGQAGYYTPIYANHATVTFSPQPTYSQAGSLANILKS